MNRQQRTLIVLVVALVAASVAAYGVYGAITRIQVREVEVASKYTVVAAKAMPSGALVTKDVVKLVPWPVKSPLTGGFDHVEDVVDRGLISGVVENEPLTESKLAPKSAGAGLPPAITPGMRAMSVKVNEVIGVAGFVVPGTRVDVLVTIRQKDESTTRVAVNNVQVLTAGTRYDQENAQREGKPIPSTVVTLLVSPEDAERIALAQSEGQLMLSLRNPMDLDPTETHGVRTRNLFGPEPPAPAPPTRPAVKRSIEPVVIKEVAAPPPQPKQYLVEAIRAAKRTEEPVR
jgi:pilus assembly protein CpaB